MATIFRSFFNQISIISLDLIFNCIIKKIYDVKISEKPQISYFKLFKGNLRNFLSLFKK